MLDVIANADDEYDRCGNRDPPVPGRSGCYVRQCLPKLGRINHEDPALIAIGDVGDDGVAFGIGQCSFDEAAEVLGGGVGEEQGHGGTCWASSGALKSMCSASAPLVSMSPMSLMPTPAARRASRSAATSRSMRRYRCFLATWSILHLVDTF